MTRVAVLVAHRPSPLGPEYDDVLHDLTRRAVDAVVTAGGEPWLLDLASDVPAASDAVRQSDAVLVLGGADIDPALYGEQPHPLTVVGSRADDAYEIEAIRTAVDARTPVLAICRGLQLVNVAFGGTLLQDLGPDSAHHGPPDDLMVDTEIRPVEGSRLGAILGAEPLTVRTGNHQALARVADGLEVSARADDGVVEAVEHEQAWLLAVQFHPEDADADPAHLAALVGALVDAAGDSPAALAVLRRRVPADREVLARQEALVDLPEAVCDAGDDRDDEQRGDSAAR